MFENEAVCRLHKKFSKRYAALSLDFNSIEVYLILSYYNCHRARIYSLPLFWRLLLFVPTCSFWACNLGAFVASVLQCVVRVDLTRSPLLEVLEHMDFELAHGF